MLSVGGDGEAVWRDLKKLSTGLPRRAGRIVEIQTSGKLRVRLDIRLALVVHCGLLPEILVRSSADNLKLRHRRLIGSGRDGLSLRTETNENGDCRDKVPFHGSVG